MLWRNSVWLTDGGILPADLISDHGQGRNEVRWRPGREASLAPPCSNLRYFGSKCSVLKEVLVKLLGFSAPLAVIRHRHSDSAPGELCLHCPPRYALDHGRRNGVEGGPCPTLDFEFWYFPMNVLEEKCFSYFRVGKIKFHHCWHPLEKCLWPMATSWKISLMVQRAQVRN